MMSYLNEFDTSLKRMAKYREITLKNLREHPAYFPAALSVAKILNIPEDHQERIREMARDCNGFGSGE